MALRFLLLALAIHHACSWEAVPKIPAGRRSQFLVLHEDGGYKYGYDSGDGLAAKQSADAANQVSGHYFYKNSLGQDVDLKYTAGVQGFVPEGYEKFLPKPDVAAARSQAVPQQQDEAGTGDASYHFTIKTDTYQREESSDAKGNVQGRYSYNNQAGVHDLSYVAGENKGFVAASGSLARANGLGQTSSSLARANGQTGSSQSSKQAGVDGSYSFAYSVGDSSRQESADANNNVKGSYSYQNEAGSHDLSYVAGAKTGFQVTGGSLANGLGSSSAPAAYSAKHQVPSVPHQTPSGYQVPSVPHQTPSGHQVPSAATSYSAPQQDGSYSFSFSLPEHTRQEAADAKNNVQGSYSYKDAAGHHDLKYVAGSETGFLPVGGSLATPNGLPNAPSYSAPASHPVASSYSAPASHPVASSYSAPVSRPVSSPYSAPAAPSVPSSEDDQADTGDSSYSFTIDTEDYQRKETSDAKGNVQGSYSYKNGAGRHDLKYVAGSKTGFLPVGGSLAAPNGVPNAPASHPVASSYSAPASHPVPSSYSAPAAHPVSSSYSAPASRPVSSYSAPASQPEDDQADTGDSSYSFTIDTEDYQRKETSDAKGNVQGSYSYKNEAGTHDLSYIAGSNTGFVAVSGSLSDPNAIAAKIASLPYNKQASHAAPVLAKSSVNQQHSIVSSDTVSVGSDEQSSGDASYSFSIDTDEYKRQEESDANGNVKGSYSYKNSAGNHDLSFVAGSATGFAPVGGSLKTVPGLSEAQLVAGEAAARSAHGSSSSVSGVQSYSAKSASSHVSGGSQSYSAKSASSHVSGGSQSYSANSQVSGVSSKISYPVGKNFVVHSYLPPSNEKRKFGYIFDSL